MKAIKKLASETAVYGISSILGRFLNYLLVPIHTNVLDKASYGINSELYAYVSFLMIIFTYGMQTAYFRFAQSEEDKNKVFSTSLISLAISTAVLFAAGMLFYKQIAATIHYQEHPEYILYFLLILSFDALCAIPFARLRQQQRPWSFAGIQLISIFVNIGLNLYFLLACPYVLEHYDHQGLLYRLCDWVYEPGHAVAYIFMANLMGSAVTLLLFIPSYKAIFAGFDPKLWNRMMKYAWPLVPLGLAGMVNETLDRALMKYLISDEHLAMQQLGIYGACYKVSILMTLFIQAFRFAAEPFFFARSAEKDARELYSQVMNYFSIVCFFIFLLVMLNMQYVQYFIGPQFREGLSVVPVLLFANMFLGIYLNLSIWFKLSDKTSYGAVISIIGAVITIALNLLWIPTYGYTGSAWATFCCYLSMLLICYFMGRKYYPIPYQLGRFFRYAIACLLLYAVGILLEKQLGRGYLLTLLNNLLLLLFGLLVFFSEKGGKYINSPLVSNGNQDR